jgi:hypothetical protein
MREEPELSDAKVAWEGSESSEAKGCAPAEAVTRLPDPYLSKTSLDVKEHGSPFLSGYRPP